MTSRFPSRSAEIVIFCACVGIVLASILPGVLAVSVAPGPLFRLRTGHADIHFQNTNHFSKIQVQNNALVFDNVRFGIEKGAAPNLAVTITVWNPLATSGTVIEFLGASLGGNENIYFNDSGLNALTYTVTVNGAPQGAVQGPSFSFPWSTWTSQQDIAFSVSSSAPPAPPGGGGIVPIPSAYFVYRIRALTTIVDFFGVGDTTDTWLWTFGDGMQSSSQNPSHEYRGVLLFSTFAVTYRHCTPLKCSISSQSLTVVNVFNIVLLTLGIIVPAVVVGRFLQSRQGRRLVRGTGDVRIAPYRPKIVVRRTMRKLLSKSKSTKIIPREIRIKR